MLGTWLTVQKAGLETHLLPHPQHRLDGFQDGFSCLRHWGLFSPVCSDPCAWTCVSEAGQRAGLKHGLFSLFPHPSALRGVDAFPVLSDSLRDLRGPGSDLTVPSRAPPAPSALLPTDLKNILSVGISLLRGLVLSVYVNFKPVWFRPQSRQHWFPSRERYCERLLI